jgi:hypothetical protein
LKTADEEEIMHVVKVISAAVAGSMLMAIPAAAPAQASQPRASGRYEQACAAAATRTDEAGRAWHEEHCSKDARNWRRARWAATIATATLFLGGLLAKALV